MSAKEMLEAVLKPDGEGIETNQYKAVPAQVVREALELLPKYDSGLATFLRAYLQSRESDLGAGWRRGFEVLRALHGRQFGRSPHGGKLPSLAVEPLIARAIQAAVVSDAQRKTYHPAMLEMLAIEGSEASVDALMPHVERAAVEPEVILDDLSGFEEVAAKTPGMRAVMSRVVHLFRERQANSPALALARDLGFSGLNEFRFSLYIDAPEPFREGVLPLLVAEIFVDSAKAQWLTIWVDGMRRRTHGVYRQHGDAVPGNPNELGLPPCTIRELPQWLRLVERKLAVEWGQSASLDSNLDEDHEEKLLSWVGFEREDTEEGYY